VRTLLVVGFSGAGDSCGVGKIQFCGTSSLLWLRLSGPQEWLWIGHITDLVSRFILDTNVVPSTSVRHSIRNTSSRLRSWNDRISYAFRSLHKANAFEARSWIGCGFDLFARAHFRGLFTCNYPDVYHDANWAAPNRRSFRFFGFTAAKAGLHRVIREAEFDFSGRSWWRVYRQTTDMPLGS